MQQLPVPNNTVRPRTPAQAFHMACLEDRPDCAEWLVRAGCDVGVKRVTTQTLQGPGAAGPSGLTGRQIAEYLGHAAVVERLRALEAEQPPAGAVARVHGLVRRPPPAFLRESLSGLLDPRKAPRAHRETAGKGRAR